MEELQLEVEKELKELKLKKNEIKNDLLYINDNMNINTSTSDFLQLITKNQKLFSDLKYESNLINNGINTIAGTSSIILQNFESLKYRKKNLEDLLNAMTSMVELRKLLPKLEKTVKEINLEQSIKIIKIYQSLEKSLIKDYCQIELQRIQNLIENLKELVKLEFEKAINQNDNEKIGICSSISNLLGMEDNNIGKIMKIYTQKLNDELSSMTQKISSIPLSYKYTNLEKYDFIFFNIFLDLLGIIAKLINSCKSSIYLYFKSQGVFSIIEHLINNVMDPYIKDIFNKLITFYELGSINANSFVSNPQNFVNILMRIDLFCEEISNISNQSQNFYKHMVSIFNTFKNENKNDEIDLNSIDYKFQSTTLNSRVTELLGKFIFYEQIYLKQQVLLILENSPSYKSFSTFNKNFFINYVEKEECLYNYTVLYDYLDDVFFMAKTAANRALFTLNKSTVCAIFNYLTNEFFAEDFFHIISSLLQKYIKREYFTNVMICFNKKFVMHNTFLIVLMNNVEMLINYLKKLKVNLLEEYQELFPDEKLTMIYSCIEELETINTKKFEDLCKEKLKIISEFLKLTIRNEIDVFKEINFQISEAGIEEYERKGTFSKEFRSNLSLYLNQWKFQFTKNNFEIFILSFTENLSKTLEQNIMSKKFHQIGVILLDKEIRNIINFFQNLVNINVKRSFNRLTFICEILMLESLKDMEEFYSLGMGEISLDEIKKVMKLRSDLSI